MTQQEQPDHPLPSVFRSAAPAVAVIAAVVTAQEQPFHPQPSVGISVQAQPVITLPAVNRAAISVRQDDLDQFFVATEISLAGPNQAALPNVNQYPRTTQEQPDFTPGWARIGVPPTAAVITLPAVNRAAISTRQDDIDFAFVALEMSIPGPNQAPPPFSNIATVQEAPNDIVGPSWARIGTPPVQTTFVLPAVTRVVYTSQEQPFHPGSFAKLGVQPPANFVSPAVSTEVYTTQEQPFHPGPSAKAGVPPNVVAPLQGRIVSTLQELPYHPLPPTFVQFIPHPVTPVPPSTGRPTTVSEVPDHPVIQSILGAPGGKGTFVPPPLSNPATYYMLEDHWINQQYLPAGTIQTTADLGGALPINWVPTANVDPVDTNAVAAYTAAGFQRRGLTRQQFTPLPVRQPNYDWQIINNEPVLVKVRNNF